MALTFYFDRCFGTGFPEALLKMKSPFTVEYHHSPQNRFPQEMPDDEWLAIAGQRKWIVFSHDRKFHDESPSIEAIKQHRVACFYLWGANVPIWDKYVCLAKSYKRINEIIQRTKRPYIYRVAYNYRVHEVRIP